VASKSADVRPKITLACSECKERNYITKKNRRNTPDRLSLKKFCARCGKHTEHRETRIRGAAGSLPPSPRLVGGGGGVLFL